MKVSVVVTSYNLENKSKEIKECLESIKNQTLDSIEVIFCYPKNFINISIYDMYKEKFEKVIYLEDNNINLSKNKAIDICSGEYIYFIENTDKINSELLEKLYSHSTEENLDMITFDYTKNNQTSLFRENELEVKDKFEFIDRGNIIEEKNYDGKELFVRLSNDENLIYLISIYFFNVKFIRENNIEYIKYSDYDCENFIFDSLIYSNKIRYINYSGLELISLNEQKFLNFNKIERKISILQKTSEILESKDLINAIFRNIIKDYHDLIINSKEYAIYINVEKIMHKLDDIKKQFNNLLDIETEIEYTILKDSPILKVRFSQNNNLKFKNVYTDLFNLTQLYYEIKKNNKFENEQRELLLQNIYNYKIVYGDLISINNLKDKLTDELIIIDIENLIKEVINDIELLKDKQLVKYRYIEEKIIDIVSNI